MIYETKTLKSGIYFSPLLSRHLPQSLLLLLPAMKHAHCAVGIGSISNCSNEVRELSQVHVQNQKKLNKNEKQYSV